MDIEKIAQEYKDGVGGTTLSKKYGIPSTTLYREFHRHGVVTRNNRDKSLRSVCNEHYFDAIDTEEKAYWLGFIFADGYITSKTKNASQSVGISLSVVDVSHLKKFLTAIQGTQQIKFYNVSSGYKPGAPYCRVLISSQIMVDALKSHGIIERKTDTLTPPQIDYDLREAFIRGFFDGDGSVYCITSNKVVPAYSCDFLGTDSMLIYIMKHLYSANAISHIYKLYKRKPNQTVSSIKLGGNMVAYKALNYMYKDATVFLDRKYEKYLNLQQQINSRSQKKLCELSDGELLENPKAFSTKTAC